MQACNNFDNDGTCVADCPPRLVYDPDTASFETNDDFRFHSGSLCVESCPSELLATCCDMCPQGYCQVK